MITKSIVFLFEFGIQGRKMSLVTNKLCVFKPEHISLIFTVCFRQDKEGLLPCYSLRDGGGDLSWQYAVYICSKHDASITSADQRTLRTQTPTLNICIFICKTSATKTLNSQVYLFLDKTEPTQSSSGKPQSTNQHRRAAISASISSG